MLTAFIHITSELKVSMATSATLYNDLPTLGEADEHFNERTPIFAALDSLLAQHNNVWGACLVHAHCKLAEDEIMLGKGDISQPESVLELSAVEYYPERWLPSGEPYEFTTRRTTTPPIDLIQAFNKITSNVGVLGLFHIDKTEKKKPRKMIERTEGRKNILAPYTNLDEVNVNAQTETAWDLSSLDPVTMACNSIIVCDTRSTRTAATHKGKFSNS